MASLANMIDLKLFPKLGVRVPVALKRKVRQLALDMEVLGITSQDGELSMEAIFAVAVLNLLDQKQSSQAEAFQVGLAKLNAMFEAEMPNEKSPTERSGADPRVSVVFDDDPPSVIDKPKRSGRK